MAICFMLEMMQYLGLKGNMLPLFLSFAGLICYTEIRVNVFVLEQFFLFDLQLQHDSIQLHVQIVGSLQFPLVVLPDVQCMSGWREKGGDTDINTQTCTFIYYYYNRISSFFPYCP